MTTNCLHSYSNLRPYNVLCVSATEDCVDTSILFVDVMRAISSEPVVVPLPVVQSTILIIPVAMHFLMSQLFFSFIWVRVKQLSLLNTDVSQVNGINAKEVLLCTNFKDLAVNMVDNTLVIQCDENTMHACLVVSTHSLHGECI